MTINIERLTITLSLQMAQSIRDAVATGEYVSSSEIVREALRDWQRKRTAQERQLSGQPGDGQSGTEPDKDADRAIRKRGRKRAPRAPST